MPNKPRVGIVGYSDFSKLLASTLQPFTEVIVSSRRDVKDPEVTIAPLTDVLKSDIVIPCFPSQHFESFFSEHAAKLRPGSLVVDVCSVKVRPIAVLEHLLPDAVQILATHPLFGPGSAKQGVAGRTIMVNQVRLSDESYKQTCQFLSEQLHLKVVETSLEEHDKAMVYVLGLSQYIGRALKAMNIPDTPLMTAAYADLLDLKNIQGTDSWELFESIITENPYTASLHDDFVEALSKVHRELNR